MTTYANPVYRVRACRPSSTARRARTAGRRRRRRARSASPRRSISAQRGVPVVVLDDDDTVSVGSRAICYAKRTLEILDRLGCGEPIVDKGVGWNVGKVFFTRRARLPVRSVPEPGHRRPGVRQPAAVLLRAVPRRARARRCPASSCAGTAQGRRRRAARRRRRRDGRHARRRVRARLRLADRRATARAARCGSMLGLEWRRAGVPRPLPDRRHPHDSRTFRPSAGSGSTRRSIRTSRRCCTGRPTTSGASISSSAGTPIPTRRSKPERILPRLARDARATTRDFEIEWASVYTFQCRRMQRFRHGRVLFAGDAAHLVSPFGARGANSGIQDADNLAWKLALVLRGQAPDALLDSYDVERVARRRREHPATRRARPTSSRRRARCRARSAMRCWRSRSDHPFARRLVNSGRLSVPAMLRRLAAQHAGSRRGLRARAGAMVPGAPAADAPVRGDRAATWLLDYLGGGFTLLAFGAGRRRRTSRRSRATPIPCRSCRSAATARRGRDVDDVEGLVRDALRRAAGHRAILLRPDQHVCARWRAFDRASGATPRSPARPGNCEDADGHAQHRTQPRPRPTTSTSG